MYILNIFKFCLEYMYKNRYLPDLNTQGKLINIDQGVAWREVGREKVIITISLDMATKPTGCFLTLQIFFK